MGRRLTFALLNAFPIIPWSDSAHKLYGLELVGALSPCLRITQATEAADLAKDGGAEVTQCTAARAAGWVGLTSRGRRAHGRVQER